MSYVGLTAEISLGNLGLVGTKNPTQTVPGQLILSRSVSLVDGTLQKRGGATKYNSSAISGTPSITGGWDWHPSIGTQRMIVVTSAGAVLRDTGDGTFATTLKSGLTVTDVVPMFVEGGKEVAANNRKLFLFSEKNPVQVLSGDGVTTSDIATPPADWSGTNQPVFGVNHEDRIWGGGNANDPHRMYYPDTGNHENYTTGNSGSISVYPGEGERLIGGVSFKGILIVGKRPAGIYAIDTRDPNVANWKVSKLSDVIGWASPLAAVPIDDDVMFMDITGGIHLISGIDEFGNLGTRDLTDIAELRLFLDETFNQNRTQFIRMVYDVQNAEVLASWSRSGSTVNDGMLVIDLNLQNQDRQSIPRYGFSDRDVAESLWLRKETTNKLRPVIGDNAGFVWKLDQPTLSKDGAGYEVEFQTPHDDLSRLDPALATKQKNFGFLELVSESTGDFNVDIDVIIDGVITNSLVFNLGSSGGTLGSFTLGTDKLGSDSIINRRKRISGSGRRISLLGKNDGNGQGISLARAFVSFTAGDERQ